MQLEMPTSDSPVRTAQTDTVAPTSVNGNTVQNEFSTMIREKFAVSGWGLIGTLLTSLFFIYCSYLPVYHTDIWGHVSYGDWILKHGKLPVEDPYVDLAAGVDIINNAWLSQVIFSLLTAQSGAQGLSDGYALLCLGIFLSLFCALTLRTGSWGLGFLAAGGTWAMITFRLSIVRPELFGELCFALLFCQLALIDRFRSKTENVRQSLPLWGWLSIPMTFTLWTNLHGTFVIGFAVLGAAVLGSFCSAVWLQRSFKGIWCDSRLRSDIMLLQLCILAACLNPYGIDLLLQTALFPTHPNLKSVMEWFPLEMVSLEGIPMAMSWLFAAFLIRHSRVPFSVRDSVLLLLLSAAVCLRVRMIAWYAPAYFFVMAPHLADVYRRVAELQLVQKVQTSFAWMSRPSFHFALISSFVCYLTFAFTPVSRHVMGGSARPEARIVSSQTPIGVTDYFAKHPQQGLIYAPQWWGDWMNWKLDGQVKVFVSTNSIHLVPEKVWDDYMTMSLGRPGADALLSRYRINTMVVSKDLQPGLVKMMDKKEGWRKVFDDKISVIFQRSTLATVSTEVAQQVH